MQLKKIIVKNCMVCCAKACYNSQFCEYIIDLLLHHMKLVSVYGYVILASCICDAKQYVP